MIEMTGEEALEPVWFIRITRKGALMSLPRVVAYASVKMGPDGYLYRPDGEPVMLLDAFCARWFDLEEA